MAIRRAVAAALSAALAAAVLTAAPAVAATAFTVSGTAVLHPPPHPEQLLPAHFAGDTVNQVDYPAAVLGMDASIAIAAAALHQGVLAGAGKVVAAGFSQGAIAVAYAKQSVMALAADMRPAADRLSFVTIGDPTCAQGILQRVPFRVPIIGLTPFTPPETPYDTVVVNGEYDGWADFPDRPWNLISLANALLGIAYVHGGYETIPGGLDLSVVPASNVSTTTNSLGGITTTYLIPTQRLPLVQPLRDIGVPEPIVTAIEQPLKTIVDAGYARNDVKIVAAQSLTAQSAGRPDSVRRAAQARAAASPGGPRRVAAGAGARAAGR